MSHKSVIYRNLQRFDDVLYNQRTGDKTGTAQENEFVVPGYVQQNHTTLMHPDRTTAKQKT